MQVWLFWLLAAIPIGLLLIILFGFIRDGRRNKDKLKREKWR